MSNPEEFIQLPNGAEILSGAQSIIKEWIDYTCSVVVVYPDEVENVEAAIRKLGEAAQGQYPQLESGEKVVLHLSQTEGLLDGLHFGYADAYIGITGAAILVCQDGPKIGADLLAEQVGYLKDKVWNEGGANADDGDS